jgi:hypothetical protein
MFSPYGYDDLRGYVPRYTGSNPSAPGQAALASSTTNAPIEQLAQMCGEESRNIAGLPIDEFQRTIQLNDVQRSALEELASASAKASRDIKAACPTDISLTGPARLASMQQRIEVMIAAVTIIVQPALNKFYDLLNDEQKARLAALGKDRRQTSAAEKTAGLLNQNCGTAQSNAPEWPTAEIERTVRPTEAQRASLVALQAATAKAEDMLKSSCQHENSLTPPARLAAVGNRLDTMLQAVKTVRSALVDFYGSLNDEQKARFEAIGPQQMSQLEQPAAAQTQVRRHRSRNINSLLRQLIIRF